MAAIRIEGLSTIDPLAVPLPHGTEVTTRVDRWVGERRIPLGAIGRVVGSEGKQLQVAVVGVGVVSYVRDELLPRKIGQLKFAARRAASWERFGPCIVLESMVGSRAWGLAEAGSDTDRRGVFAAPFPWTVGLSGPPLDLISADASSTYWEVRKVVLQALRADPNTLEMLFVPTATARDPIGEWILASRSAFVSTEIYGSFGRYALSQLKKLVQSMRLAEHRETVLAWLREDPPPNLDQLARRLAAVSIEAAPSRRDAELKAKEYIKQLYRSLYDQGLLPAKELSALIELARKQSETGFELPRELRPKNAYNLLRLIRCAVDWLRDGEPSFVASGAFRTQLLSIKRGEVPLEEVITAAEGMSAELEAARQQSRLPPQADHAAADALLSKIGEEIARRWLAAEPGPFGRDA